MEGILGISQALPKVKLTPKNTTALAQRKMPRDFQLQGADLCDCFRELSGKSDAKLITHTHIYIYNIIQHYILLYITILYYIIFLFYIVLYYFFMLYYFILYSIVLYFSFILNYIILYYTILYYIICIHHTYLLFFLRTTQCPLFTSWLDMIVQSCTTHNDPSSWFSVCPLGSAKERAKAKELILSFSVSFQPLMSVKPRTLR